MYREPMKNPPGMAREGSEIIGFRAGPLPGTGAERRSSVGAPEAARQDVEVRRVHEPVTGEVTLREGGAGA